MFDRLSFCVLLLASTLVIGDGPAQAHPAHDRPLLGGIFPQLSSDAKTIVFSFQGSIWRVPRDGGVMTQLTDGAGFDCRPCWSPDGKRIAYVQGRSSFTGPLRLISASDGGEIELPTTHVARDKLFFSADGNRLLSVFPRDNETVLCWLDLTNGKLSDKVLDAGPGMRYALSHDGATIAFATTQDKAGQQGGNNGPQCDLWTIPAEGGKATKVCRFPGRVYELAWQADGESLLLVSNVGGVHNDVWQLPLDDPLRGAEKLTFGQADEDSPSVDHAGRYLLYTDNRRGLTAMNVRDFASDHDAPIAVARRQFKRLTGPLKIFLRDGDSGEAVTARVSVLQQDGKYYAPPESIYRMLRGEMHFYCEGEATLEVPIGKYRIKVARGPEYPIITQEVDVQVGSQTTVPITLQRWIDQHAGNWYSGESHIHANYGYGQWYNSPRTMLLQSTGEDLVVSNFMVANSEADGVFDREFFRGEPDPLSTDRNLLYWNQEFRSTIWGHLTLLNLKHLVEPIFTGFAHTTHPHDHPTNADIADHTHDQDGHVNYTHPAHSIEDPYLSAYSAKALPLDVALGKVDSIDVMGSNHLATMPLWYRLLNCGFHVPASAGTDCFLNRVISKLPGQDRVYVHVEGEFTYQKWIESLREGQTFVTNGPMLEFTLGGRMAGSTIKLAAPGKVQVTARVRSRFPIDQYEIIQDGKVAASADLNAEHLDRPLNFELSVQRSGWIALRVGGPPQAEQPTGSVFAHSGAIYIEVSGTTVDARSDAEYFVAWIDRLHSDIRLRNRVPSRYQVHVESQMADARDVFNGLIADER